MDAASEQVNAFTRGNGRDRLLVAVNFTDEAALVDLTGAGAQSFADLELLLSNYDGIAKTNVIPGTLRPCEAIVARIKTGATSPGE